MTATINPITDYDRTYIHPDGTRWKLNINMQRRGWDYGSHSPSAKTRVYVNGIKFDEHNTKSNILPTWRAIGVEPEGVNPDSIAYTSRGEYPQVDAAFDRENRLTIKGWRSVCNAISDEIGVTGVTFSRKAGCGCGCSPGFIAKDGERSRGWDIHVAVSPLTDED